MGEYEAPVVEAYARPTLTSPSKKPSGNYKVKRGDTLYSIAWANHLDYRTLAKINQLSPPYKIYTGQFLKTRLGFFQSLEGLFTGKSKPPKKLVQKKNKIFSTHDKKMTERDTDRYEIIHPRHNPPLNTPPIENFKRSTPVKGWKWPSRGKIVQGYSTQPGGNKGLNFSGVYGAPVLAAASGKVVYSGSGLKGYGPLLLIKHNRSFLSAYAHNSRLFVKEGEEVRAGQKIAEMGRANHGKVRLHFEIRQNGQPVNPMRYLASK